MHIHMVLPAYKNESGRLLIFLLTIHLSLIKMALNLKQRILTQDDDFHSHNSLSFQ